MADYTITKENDTLFLKSNNRVFLPSNLINVFPCARRGQSEIENTVEYYDPEARLNTEHTNRINTAVNGFTNSFIITNPFTSGSTLIFVLAGYYVEVKNFNPANIASSLEISNGSIYAHLSLHKDIYLDVDRYYTTEILYRQSDLNDNTNYLDIHHDDASSKLSGDFFMGVSFTKDDLSRDSDVIPYHLPLFHKPSGAEEWELIETSLLPRIEHDTTTDSIKIFGDFTVEHAGKSSFKITKNETTLGPTQISELTVTDSATVNSLVVGERAPTDSAAAGVITAKTSVEAPTLEATTEVETPQLRVNRITSDEGEITVDNKKLIVNKSLEMLAKEGVTTPAKATIEQAVIGDLTVKTDSKLTNSTGKITAKEVSADKITQNGRAIPAINLVEVEVEGGTTYQLQITLDASKK